MSPLQGPSEDGDLAVLDSTTHLPVRADLPNTKCYGKNACESDSSVGFPVGRPDPPAT